MYSIQECNYRQYCIHWSAIALTLPPCKPNNIDHQLYCGLKANPHVQIPQKGQYSTNCKKRSMLATIERQRARQRAQGWQSSPQIPRYQFNRGHMWCTGQTSLIQEWSHTATHSIQKIHCQHPGARQYIILWLTIRCIKSTANHHEISPEIPHAIANGLVIPCWISLAHYLWVLFFYSESLSVTENIECPEPFTHSRKVISIPATAVQTCTYHPDTSKLPDRHVFLIQNMSSGGKQEAEMTFWPFLLRSYYHPHRLSLLPLFTYLHSPMVFLFF